MMRCSARFGLWMVLCMVAAGGCSSEPKRYPDPHILMMDKSEGLRVRWAAARQAEREMFDSPDRMRNLQILVWETGYPADFSNYAVDQLILVDEAEAKRFLANAVVLVRDWNTLEYIFDVAVKRNWVDFVPALVRNYSLSTPQYRDHERPERKAIEALMPGVPVEQVVLDVFARGVDADIKQRAAAWALLVRLTPDRQRLLSMLQRVEARDSLVADIKAGAVDLNVVPDNMETVTWLRMLRTEPYREFWEQSRRIVASLDADKRIGLELRHLPTLLYLAAYDREVLYRSQAELSRELSNTFDATEHHLKGPTYDGPMSDHPQRFGDWRDKLAWADLATIKLMLRFMHDQQMIAEWFEQATADHHDPSTEYGGLVRLTAEGQTRPILYKPMMRAHDLKYIPPKELIVDAYSALAHYHFHAQSFKNQRYAGPGLGDMRRVAATQQFSALVLTFIDENRLNVDYYQPGDVVIDLGTIHRR